MKIKTWPSKKMKLAKLKPALYNPRVISDRALNGLAKSIERFGLVEPIVWNKRTGNVVGGHQRLKVLLESGAEETDVTVVDFDDNEEVALNVSLNNTAIQGEFHSGNLEELLQKIKKENDVEFAELRMDDLAEALNLVLSGKKSAPDDVPKPPDEKDAKSKPGSVYAMGRHRLFCGSSLEADNVKRLCGDQKIDLLLTDPPYNVAYVGKTKDALVIDNDRMDSGEYTKFLSDAFKAADAVMNPGASFYIWYGSVMESCVLAALESNSWRSHQTLMWVKDRFVMSRNDYHYRHEPCFYGWKEGAHQWNSDRKQTTVMEFARPSASVDHPTSKPVELFEYLIQNSSKGGQNVLDSFCGSGTTVIAAERLGRNAFVLELSPSYCDVIRRRWSELVHGAGCDWEKLTQEEKPS